MRHSHRLRNLMSECCEGCPVRLLDAQSGVLKSGGGDKGGKTIGAMGYGGRNRKHFSHHYIADSGGASRFFPQFHYTEEDYHGMY